MAKPMMGPVSTKPCPTCGQADDNPTSCNCSRCGRYCCSTVCERRHWAGAPGSVPCPGVAKEIAAILQEVRGDSMNGCSEKVEDWEEPEFLVDSGASATVVGKGEVKAVKASDPDPNRHYKMADGSIIPIWGRRPSVR